MIDLSADMGVSAGFKSVEGVLAQPGISGFQVPSFQEAHKSFPALPLR